MKRRDAKARKKTLDPKQRQYYELLKMSCLYLTNSLDFVTDQKSTTMKLMDSVLQHGREKNQKHKEHSNIRNSSSLMLMYIQIVLYLCCLNNVQSLVSLHKCS